MRTFIAIELPSDIKQHLGDIARHLRRSDVQAGWVKPENLHLTLKFLGDVEQTLLPRLTEQIDDLTRRQSVFLTDPDGFGFFPSPASPRILFAALKEPTPFNSLVQHLDHRLLPLGFAPETSFHPHITLARIRSSKNLKNLRQMITDTVSPPRFAVTSIVLYSSTLHPDGVHYDAVHRAYLHKDSLQPKTASRQPFY